MLTVLFLTGIAIVAVLLGAFVIRGRSRQAQGKSGIAAERKEEVAPKQQRANGLD